MVLKSLWFRLLPVEGAGGVSVNDSFLYFCRWRCPSSSGVTDPGRFLTAQQLSGPGETEGAHRSSLSVGQTNSSTVYIIRTTGLHLAITGLGSYFFFLFCLCCLSQRPPSTTFGVSSFCPHHQQCSGRSHSGNIIPVSRLSKRINSLADSK